MHPSILLPLLAACEPDSDLICGPGTHEEDGACLPDADTSTDADTDTDSDTDADSDSDSDTDTDTDTDADTDPPPPATVCDDGVAPFDDLQAAIAAASDGDVIFVCPGTWGPVTWAGKGLDIRSTDGPTVTTIIGDIDHTALVTRDLPAGSRLEGFRLTGDGMRSLSVLDVEDSILELQDIEVGGLVGSRKLDSKAAEIRGGAVTFERLACRGNYDISRMFTIVQGDHTVRHSVFEDNSGSAYIVDISTNTSMDMSNNLFVRNDSNGSGYVLHMLDGSAADVRVRNNLWYENHHQGDALVNANIDFDNNLSVDSYSYGALYLGSTDADYNMAWSSHTKSPINNSAHNAGNTVVDPELVDPAAGDFHLQAGSPAIDGGNPEGWLDADGSRADIGVYGGPYGTF